MVASRSLVCDSPGLFLLDEVVLELDELAAEGSKSVSSWSVMAVRTLWWWLEENRKRLRNFSYFNLQKF